MDNSITQLGKDLAQAGYAKSTCFKYGNTAERLAKRYKKELSRLTREEIRQFSEELAAQNKSPSWLSNQVSALRFLYRRTLGQPEKVSFLSYPKRHKPIPIVLSLNEVHRLLGAIEVPRYQTIAMVMYGAGLRISEALALEVTDIDGARGVLHVRHGKGNKAREAKLSPSLYQWLRQYWGREHGRRIIPHVGLFLLCRIFLNKFGRKAFP